MKQGQSVLLAFIVQENVNKYKYLTDGIKLVQQNLVELSFTYPIPVNIFNDYK